MISIVICSVNTHFLTQIKENISTTLGVPYELLVWDNRSSNKGLCEVYNNMAAQARFPYICFIHEDVLMRTNNWGRLLIDIFEQDELVGLIGVAGGKYKSRAFSGWYCGHNDLDCMHLTHRTNGQDHLLSSPVNNTKPVHEVICIDGVFMVCRKTIWERIRFDEVLLKGFHLYDIDFSLRTARVCKNVVIMNLDIVHITANVGDYSDNWVKETIMHHEKRKEMLPAFVKGIATDNLEVHIAKVWMDALKARRISWHYKRKWILNQKLLSKPVLWYPVLKFLLYQPLGLKSIHKLFKK
jgi:hypothetical protein